jgi:hypothetical protein
VVGGAQEARELNPPPPHPAELREVAGDQAQRRDDPGRSFYVGHWLT